MSTESGDDERTWAADKRDFISDWRDGVADQRDSLADERDRAADEREAELNRWEHELDARAKELGLPCDAAAAAARADRSTGRDQVAQARLDAAEHRERNTADRADAQRARLGHAAPTLLALAFADIAEQLYTARSVDDVLLRIAESAVSTVEGCGMASITLSGPDGYTSAASTHPEALEVDLAQYESSEGPCLDAIGTPQVYAPAFPDARWPTLGSRPAESGVRSAVSYHLSAASPTSADPVEGSLNAYGLAESAFDDEAREIGFILAVHASAAVRAVAQRSSSEDPDGDLFHQALMSRDVIGQAKGILMERLKVSPDDAFDMLRRASQGLNVKLREVAQRLTETGELNGRDH
jgi:hypothetical protein